MTGTITPKPFRVEMPSETFTPLDDHRDASVEPRAAPRQAAPAWPEVGPEGEPAPRFLLPDHGGQAWNVTGDQVAGKPMILLFCRGLNSPAVGGAARHFAELYERVREMGWTVPTADGGHKRNPLAPSLREAYERLKSAGAEFGLTPSTRSRVKVPEKPDPEAFLVRPRIK